jgi:hypothetical protein
VCLWDAGRVACERVRRAQPENRNWARAADVRCARERTAPTQPPLLAPERVRPGRSLSLRVSSTLPCCAESAACYPQRAFLHCGRGVGGLGSVLSIQRNPPLCQCCVGIVIGGLGLLIAMKRGDRLLWVCSRARLSNTYLSLGQKVTRAKFSHRPWCLLLD